MHLYSSSEEYLFNLKATSSNEAKRMWRDNVKKKWNYTCAYCESNKNLTIDHVVPQAKGGNDFTYNVVCCCESCNRSKSHEDWQIWYSRQDFFTEQRKNAIIEWTQKPKEKNLYRYRPRKNKVL